MKAKQYAVISALVGAAGTIVYLALIARYYNFLGDLRGEVLSVRMSDDLLTVVRSLLGAGACCCIVMLTFGILIIRALRKGIIPAA